MNRIAKDIRSYFGIAKNMDFLKHYGRSKLDGAPGPGSGRYPLGSGEDANQHRGTFITRVQELRKQGMAEKDIAAAVGCRNTSELRAKYSNAINDEREMKVRSIRAMLADGQTQAEVARKLDIPESTLRSYLDERSEARTTAARATAEFLKQQVEEKGMIQVGAGAELEIGVNGISKERLKQALYILEEEGYPVYGGGVPQVTNPGKQTNIKVLCPPGTEHKEIYDYENVHTIKDYTVNVDEDGTEHFDPSFVYPASLDSKRVMIRFRDDVAPDGHTGVEKDGTIEIRRGVDDLSLGGSTYSQVRILVDDDKYMKGMALYSDDIPDGYDVVFNTNKTPDQAGKVFKDIKPDPNNPFGALLRNTDAQYYYTDENGERKLGLINKTRDEGDWGEWSKELPSQFLSKQPLHLIEKQINLSIADKRAELEEINALTNPTVKKKLLEDFANQCDSDSVHLQAAALPRQKYQVVLPIATMKDNEVYAPQFHDGETVALIRFPHGGTFEIPILKVNNKQEDGVRILGNAQDGVGVNASVAARLSGADFDGDTVLVIPCNSSRTSVRINSTEPLRGLKDFDPKIEYAGIEKKDSDGTKHYYRDGHEYKIMSEEFKQKQMGIVSNLINDMTLKGAPPEELERAVRHSMVVIDAEKHKLDWKQSEIDNGIAALKRKYQTHIDDEGNEHSGGASTLISLAKSEQEVFKRKGQPKINEAGKPYYDPDKPEGALLYKSVVETYVDKKGKTKIRTQKSTKMAETQDAHALSSGTPQEELYANYANALKALANEARLDYLHAGRIKYRAESRATYQSEVDDLLAQLNVARKNQPRETQAQLAANSEIKALIRANPALKENKKEKKKLSQQALARNRVKFGAHRHEINISQRQWDAIMAGAISENMLSAILRYANGDVIRQYATPRSRGTISAGKQARIKAMKNSGFTSAEISEALGISTSTVNKYLS